MPPFDESSPVSDPARYLRLAYWMAHAFAPIAVHCDVDDLAQAALEAAVIYAPRHEGAKSAGTSYVFSCMAGGCLREANRSRRIAYFGGSRHYAAPFRRLSRADSHHAAWSAEEARMVSGLVGLNDEDVMRAVAWSRSREEGITDDWRPEDPERFRDLLDEQVPEVVSQQFFDEDAVVAMEAAWDRHAIQRLLDGAQYLLGPRKLDVLTRRCFSEEPETLGSIGASYGLSRERIRGIESEARRILIDAAGNDLDLEGVYYRPRGPRAVVSPPMPGAAPVGTLRLRVETRGCEVRLNGAAFRPGATWERWSATEMSIGYHWFSFARPGYETAYELVRVRPGAPTSVSVRLKRDREHR